MQAKELLKKLDVGNSVAEYDKELERYFLETDVYDALEAATIDIVAGDKGTGKTALYTMLTKRFSESSDIGHPKVIAAFNPQGSPIFQKLIDFSVQKEEKYINIWKTYFFSLCGNWILSEHKNNSDELNTLDKLLSGMGLRVTIASNPESAFKRILARFENLLNWDAAEMELEMGVDGTIRIKPRVELKEREKGYKSQTVDIDGALRHLDKCLLSIDKAIWIALDRLDEAFQGNFEVELPALRGLFRSFLDMQEMKAIKLKLFVRRDLFRRITQGQFVNLTHIKRLIPFVPV